MHEIVNFILTFDWPYVKEKFNTFCFYIGITRIEDLKIILMCYVHLTLNTFVVNSDFLLVVYYTKIIDEACMSLLSIPKSVNIIWFVFNTGANVSTLLLNYFAYVNLFTVLLFELSNTFVNCVSPLFHTVLCFSIILS